MTYRHKLEPIALARRNRSIKLKGGAVHRVLIATKADLIRQDCLALTVCRLQYNILKSCCVPTGEHLSAGYQEQCGRGHHREGQEEDGVGPPCHSEDGHHWTHHPVN